MDHWGQVYWVVGWMGKGVMGGEVVGEGCDGVVGV